MSSCGVSSPSSLRRPIASSRVSRPLRISSERLSKERVNPNFGHLR